MYLPSSAAVNGAALQAHKIAANALEAIAAAGGEVGAD